MVIRFTKATRFLLICALLLVTALISIGTRSISVSAPYAAQGEPLPVVVYAGAGTALPTGIGPRELREDLEFLRPRYHALSEQDIVAALRRERALPAAPVVLVFDEGANGFAGALRPLLEEAGVPWFCATKTTALMRELRAAGFPVTRLERTAGLSLEEMLDMRR